MGLYKSLNQSPQGGLEKISYTSSNRPSGNCCKIPNKYLIRHVLGGQNGGFTFILQKVTIWLNNATPHFFSFSYTQWTGPSKLQKLKYLKQWNDATCSYTKCYLILTLILKSTFSYLESPITLIFQVKFVLLESTNSFVSHSNMKGDLQFLLIFTLEGHLFNIECL